MLSDEALLLSVHELAQTGQRAPVLLLLSQIEQPAATVKIREKGVQVGFRKVTQWNVTDILKAAAKDGKVAQLATGWKLLGPGLKIIEGHYRPEAAIIQETRHSLRAHLAKVADNQRRAFVEEAIKSFDVKAYRAAVVLSWVGAAHIIQDHIVLNHCAAFNAAGTARVAKAASNGNRYNFTPVKSGKDFGVIGEADMLQLCQDAGILHKAEKQILQDRLDLRNQCGHPNPLVIAEHTVAHHIELLMLNVYSKY
jgi:hypothetical protein